MTNSLLYASKPRPRDIDNAPHRVAEKNRQRERSAAIKIQKVWRRKLAQLQMSALRLVMVKIQTFSRSFLARNRVEWAFYQRDYNYRMTYYNCNATIIQKMFVVLL